MAQIFILSLAIMKKAIPSALTCLNLLCGCVAIVQILKGHLTTASYLIFIAAFLDLLDGLAARALNAHSEFGKQLDSLADVISFGAVPGMMMYWFLQYRLEATFPGENVRKLVQFIPFLIPAFSALRLAKFNLDKRQSSSFIGLPTPANTLLIVSLPFVLNKDHEALNAVLLNPYFIIFSSLLLSYLLVCELPMFSLKMKNFGFADNKVQYIFLFLSLVLTILFFVSALPLIMILYILLSLVTHLFNKQAK